MEGIRAILYLIILIISLINIISFSSKKRKRKDISREIISGLTPTRTVTGEERKAALALYNLEIPADEKVFTLQGGHSSLILTVKNSASETVHSLGGVVVQLENRHMRFLKEEGNRAEVILPERKKGAVILELNGGYRLHEESNLRKALDSDSAYTDENLRISPDREITEQELNRLFADLRWLPALGFTLLTALSLVLKAESLRLTAAGAALLIFLLLILPCRYPLRFRGKRKKLISLTGKLLGGPGNFVMDRFLLELPPGWDDRITPGSMTTLLAYRRDEKNDTLSVLSIPPFLSVQKEEENSPRFRADRFIQTGIMTGAILLILFFAQKMPSTISHVTDYMATKDLPRDFCGWEEIHSYPFRKGQYVSLKGIRAVAPRFSYAPLLIIDDAPLGEPDLAEFRERVKMVKTLQQTGEYSSLVSYRLDDYMDIYSFRLEILSRSEEERPAIADLEPYFSDSPGYYLLSELAEALAWAEEADDATLIPYPAGGVLLGEALRSGEPEEGMGVDFLISQLQRQTEAFIWNQTEQLNSLIEGERERIVSPHESFQISTDGQFDSWDTLVLSPEDISLYRFSSSAYSAVLDPYEIRENLPCEERMGELEDKLRHIAGPVALKGKLTGIDTDGEGHPVYLNLDTMKSYDDLETSLLTLLFYALPLLYLAAGFLYYLTGKRRALRI